MRSTLHPIHKSKIKAFSYNEIKGEVQLGNILCCFSEEIRCACSESRLTGMVKWD